VNEGDGAVRSTTTRGQRAATNEWDSPRQATTRGQRAATNEGDRSRQQHKGTEGGYE